MTLCEAAKVRSAVRAVSLSRATARAGHAAALPYIKIARLRPPCTFADPQYRGSFRNRRFESVIAEARLFAQGVREPTDRAGYDGVRRRSGDERQPGASAGRPGTIRRRTEVSAVSVLLSEPHHAVAGFIAGTNRWSRHRHAVAARFGECVEAHRRAGRQRHFLKTLDKIRRAVPGGRSDIDDRRISGRDRCGF